MPKLSDSVTRKFTHIYDATDWEVETDTGWESLEDVKQTIEYEVWIVGLVNEKFLKGADTHILFREDGSEVFLKDLEPGDLIQTKSGAVAVDFIKATGIYEEMYDVGVNSESHTYYSNDFLSHNTSAVSAYALHHAIFADRKNVKILANKFDNAKGILDRIKKMYELLPRWLQQGVLAWNAASLELENYSTISVGTTTPDSGRSASISLLILDEFAFVRNSIADEFWAAAYPVISSGQQTKVLIVSTANGLNLFYKMWIDAKEKRNYFIPYEVSWEDVPGRDEQWKKETIANLGGDVDKFEQEYQNSFQGNSNSLIPPTKLAKMVHKTPVNQSEYFKIYKEPNRSRTYFLTVDVSRGVGNDYSVIQVTDITEYPYEQVAVYRNNTIEAPILPSVIFKWAHMYNDGYVLLEANDLGEGVGDTLHQDFEYENTLLVSHQGRAGQRLGGGFSKQVRSGVMTSTRTKNIGCTNLKSMIMSDQLIINDFMTTQELSTFVSKKNSYEAEEGANDDLVMAYVVFAWAVQEPYFKDLTDKDLRIKLEKEREEELMETVPVFGFIEDGTEEDGWEDVDHDSFKYHNDFWSAGMGF